MSDAPGGGFARWSQRKHDARIAERRTTAPTALKEADGSAARAIIPAPDSQAHAQLPAGAVDANVAQERKADGQSTTARPPLPPVEELTADSDYTQFLVDGVPEAVKRAALRKLWTSDPVLACLDGLNDYDEDFNVIDTVISAAQTSYKVGRGFLDADEPEAIETPEGRLKSRVMAARSASRRPTRANQRPARLRWWRMRIRQLWQTRIGRDSLPLMRRTGPPPRRCRIVARYQKDKPATRLQDGHKPLVLWEYIALQTSELGLSLAIASAYNSSKAK